MSPKRRAVRRKLRGAQKWIVEELRNVGAGVQLTTAQIAKRVTKASRKNFHRNSIYNALRILVRRGALQVTRKGHEKLYRTSSSGTAAPAPAPAATAAASATRPTKRRTRTELAPAAVGGLPHKLGLGEILVMEVGTGYVLTATNLHGKLIVERVVVSA